MELDVASFTEYWGCRQTDCQAYANFSTSLLSAISSIGRI